MIRGKVVLIVVSILVLLYSLYLRRQGSPEALAREVRCRLMRGHHGVGVGLDIAGQAMSRESTSKILFWVGLIGLVSGIGLTILGI